MSEPVRVGFLGAGMIATVGYGILPNLTHLGNKIDVRAIADVDEKRAAEAAQQFGIPDSYSSLEQLLERDDIEAIINVTPIPFHGDTSIKILQAGKHLVTEKPLAGSLEDGRTICELAAANNLVVVSSPPDSLYAEHEEARRLVHAGVIGKVAFARIQASHGGPGGSRWPGWPTDPSWFYKEGSGPLLDMGVYGIHHAVNIFGAVKRVSSFAGISEPERVVRAGRFEGTKMEVTTPDNIVALLDFGDSRYATLDGTFNVLASQAPQVEVYGRKGTIYVYHRRYPTPLKVYRADVLPGVDGWIGDDTWKYLETAKRHQMGRAILLDHLYDVLRGGLGNRLTAERGLHELEVMLAIQQSAREGRAIDMTTSVTLPEGELRLPANSLPPQQA